MKTLVNIILLTLSTVNTYEIEDAESKPGTEPMIATMEALLFAALSITKLKNIDTPGAN